MTAQSGSLYGLMHQTCFDQRIGMWKTKQNSHGIFLLRSIELDACITSSKIGMKSLKICRRNIQRVQQSLPQAVTFWAAEYQ